MGRTTAETEQMERWLWETGGYENLCFISWPHTDDYYISACARRVQSEIRSRLADTFAKPEVFLDEASIQGGDLWERKLKKQLAGSLCMVAICAPIYFRSEHRWCGVEWASMAQLGECRLASDVTYTTIIPLMVRMVKPYPWQDNSKSESKIQCIDVSRQNLRDCKQDRRDRRRDVADADEGAVR